MSLKTIALGLIAPALLLVQQPLCAQRIAATPRHAVLDCQDGTTYAWGFNYEATLGDGTTDARSTAVRVSSDSAFRSLSCGPNNTFGVTTGGFVYVWGGVNSNVVGVATMNYIEKVPRQISHIQGVSHVAATDSRVYYLLMDGTVAVSGSNYSGGYGDGTTLTLDSGHAMVRITRVRSIHAAAVNCFAVKQDGSLMAWGSNADGLIDSSSDVDVVLTPTRIVPDVKFITGCTSYNNDHRGSVRFVTDSGYLYVWGSNKYRQLALVDDPVRVPTKVILPKRCVSIVGGERHTLALLEDGTVWAWGENTTGQLGNYTVDSVTAMPIQVIGLENVVEIAAAGNTSYAIKSNGVLYGWGNNELRQLNRDDAPRHYTPVALTLPCTIVSSVDSASRSDAPWVRPNPASESMDVDLTNVCCFNEVMQVSIYSASGGLVHQQSMEYKPSFQYDVSGLAYGTYLLFVDVGQTRVRAIFVKRK